MRNEEPLLFDCAGETLVGILHRASAGRPATGVLMVVGGPQYRVGSHRQFVLLARDLARTGIPVMRFDYRGMGDSSGAPRDFSDIGGDIRAALDSFTANLPGLERVVLWGLCDAASANALYAPGDARVAGQIALNPWVRTAEGEAEAYIRHYYLQRVLSGAFWRKVVSLEFDVARAVKDFVAKLRQSRDRGQSATADEAWPLPQRVQAAQLAFSGPTLVILSGQDLTAKEYEGRVAESPEWRRWLSSGQVTVHRLEQADHTFSRAAWRDQVAAWSRDWVLALTR